jgi:hypothetical protein
MLSQDVFNLMYDAEVSVLNVPHPDQGKCSKLTVRMLAMLIRGWQRTCDWFTYVLFLQYIHKQQRVTDRYAVPLHYLHS